MKHEKMLLLVDCFHAIDDLIQKLTHIVEGEVHAAQARSTLPRGLVGRFTQSGRLIFSLSQVCGRCYGCFYGRRGAGVFFVCDVDADVRAIQSRLTETLHYLPPPIRCNCPFLYSHYHDTIKLTGINFFSIFQIIYTILL